MYIILHACIYAVCMCIQAPRGPRKGEEGRPREKIVLPKGWQLIYKVRKTGLKKGPPDRFFVAPDGTLLRSKKEMEAHLYLDSLGCLDVAGTAACLDAAEKRKVRAGVAK